MKAQFDRRLLAEVVTCDACLEAAKGLRQKARVNNLPTCKQAYSIVDHIIGFHQGIER